MGKAIHENNENWIPTNKKYFTVAVEEDHNITSLTASTSAPDAKSSFTMAV